MSDITPDSLALKLDRIDSTVSEFDGARQGIPSSTNSQDSSSVGDDRSIVKLLGPSMEHMNA
jgi:hypothetical protein